MKIIHFTRIPAIFFLVIYCLNANSQSLPTGQELKYNPITTAVPFLTIAPDSRHGAMGDAGVATSADANAQYWNASKLAFVQDKFGLSLSYTPWLRQLVSDINLAYLSGYYQLDDYQTFGSSLRYFSMGEITLTDQTGTSLGSISSNEFSLDVSYARKLSDEFSGAVTLRYIRSDLTAGYGSETYEAGNAFATDVSFLYKHNFGKSDHDQSIAAGINVSNIGSKISYDGGQNKEFLPANLKLGTTYSKEFDDRNAISFSLDMNKLLVPTPQPNSNTTVDGSTGPYGDNYSNASSISAIFSSFSDAPGGTSEEFKEVNFSFGTEYWYNRQFAVRAGYFYESEYKGNRKFFSTGLGLKMNICSIDFAYLIPTQQNNPLANTVRFTLLFDVNSFSGKRR